MRCITLISITLGLIICSTYVESRANSHHVHSSERNPISQASVEDDDSLEEFEKFRRATVSVLLDSDSAETTDQLLMRAKLLAYVEKLKAQEAKKKAKADKKAAKAAKEKAFLAAFAKLAATTTTSTVAPATDSTAPDATTETSSESVESTESDVSTEVTEATDKAARATFNVTVSDSAESSDDLLMRAKLVAYVEKLKAKEAKKTVKAKAKAEKDKLKAAKEQAFLSMFLVTTPPPADATTDGPSKRQAPAAPTQSAAEILAQAKLDAYVAKLQAKQEKAKLKAQKKAAKEKMFADYLAAASSATYGTPGAGAGPGTGTASAVAPAPILPILPFPGALGLWNKSLFLNGLFTSMANANAAAAAAAAQAAATPAPATPQPTAEVAQQAPPLQAVSATAEATTPEEESTEVNDIEKRRAPKHWEESAEEEEPEEATDVEPEVPAEAPVDVPRYRPKHQYTPSRPFSARDQQILDFWAKYNKDAIPNTRTDIGNRHRPGATNDFKTGPAGSPNGVGYAESPVSQAGCSGSHIHSCSGMTVYINKPEGNDSQDNPKDSQKAPVREESPKKHHHHKGGYRKRSAAKA